jgi:hypothetical protein
LIKISPFSSGELSIFKIRAFFNKIFILIILESIKYIYKLNIIMVDL